MKKSVNPKLLLTAMLFFAVLAFMVGVGQVSERHHLLNRGMATTGVVVGIDVGVRGLRSVEAKFTTFDGHEVVGRDLHKTQWIDANNIGDRIALHYDPEDPEKILIDRGSWLWSNPAFLIAGGVFVCGLGVFIYKRSATKPISR